MAGAIAIVIVLLIFPTLVLLSGGVASAIVGTPCEDIDSAARNVIAEAGYGEYFVHRTGHGIGMEEHEDPYIVEGNERPLEAGHAFSIEPGIYVPAKWGMRLEDIVVATDDGLMAAGSVDGPDGREGRLWSSRDGVEWTAAGAPSVKRVQQIVYAAGAETLDAGGCYVMPGGIDPHTHLQGSFVDDLTTGTAAARANPFDAIDSLQVRTGALYLHRSDNNDDVIVVGGGNSAVTEALHLHHLHDHLPGDERDLHGISLARCNVLCSV